MDVSKDSGIVGVVFAAVIGAFGWLLNRMFRSIRHDINDAKQLAINAAALASIKADKQEVDRQRDNIAKIFDTFRLHEQADRDRHDELLTMITDGQLKIMGKLAELKE